MSTTDFVRQSLEGNAVEAQETFNALMQSRLAGKIDAYRQTTAAGLFTQPEVETNDEVDSPE